MKRAALSILLLALVAGLGYAAGATRVADEPATLTKGQVADIICMAGSNAVVTYTFNAATNTVNADYTNPDAKSNPDFRSLLSKHLQRAQSHATSSILPLLRACVDPNIRFSTERL